jgi:hypothetical protein
MQFHNFKIFMLYFSLRVGKEISPDKKEIAD